MNLKKSLTFCDLYHKCLLREDLDQPVNSPTLIRLLRRTKKITSFHLKIVFFTFIKIAILLQRRNFT